MDWGECGDWKEVESGTSQWLLICSENKRRCLGRLGGVVKLEDWEEGGSRDWRSKLGEGGDGEISL